MMKPSKTRVVLIDQTMALQEELSQIENQMNDYVVVGAFNDVRTAYFSFLRSRPDIIAISIHQNDQRVFKIIGKIKNQYPSVKILIQGAVDNNLNWKASGTWNFIPLQTNWAGLKIHLDNIRQTEIAEMRRWIFA